MRNFLIHIYHLYANLRSSIFYLLLKKAGNKIGKGVFIHWNSEIKSRTQIGNYTRINGRISIRGTAEVKIGKYCAIGTNITIISNNHNMNYANVQDALQKNNRFKVFTEEKLGVTLGNNIWIGDNALILAGVCVGDGSVIGAGSIVTKDIKPFSVVAGVPARTIRKRFKDEIIKKLLDIQWWNWSEEKIRYNQCFFETDLRHISPADIDKLIK